MKSHFAKRVMGSLLGVALAAAGMVLGAAPASGASTFNIVALGDSYGSGTGAGDYLDGTGVANGCWRSANSYSAKVADWVRDGSWPVAFTNVTCSGAATEDLRQTFKGQPAQLDALRADTHLVLLNIGANDIDFAAYATQCVLGNCAGDPTYAVLDRIPGMSDTVLALLGEIKARSPEAAIVLTGYGSQLTAGANTPGITLDPICGAGVFTSVEREDGNLVAKVLDIALREAARKADVLYASPYAASLELEPAFAGHSLCQSTEPYYRGFDALSPGQEGLEAVLHPNAAGQAALADLVLDRLTR